MRDNYPGLEVNVTINSKELTLLNKVLQMYAPIASDIEELEIIQEMSRKFLTGVRPVSSPPN